MAVQKIHASTQKFTEIVDFGDNIVLFEGGYAAMVIEVTASNFALLSRREQDSKIYSYAALLNSLSFPIQILIRNKRMDISSYLKELDEAAATTKNPQLARHIKLYRTFVQEMVIVNVVLNKSFYIVISFSALEGGVTGVSQSIQTGQAKTDIFAVSAMKNLESKANALLPQLQKISSTARVLEKEDLIKLFYDEYNEGVTLDVAQTQEGVETPIVTQAKV